MGDAKELVGRLAHKAALEVPVELLLHREIAEGEINNTFQPVVGLIEAARALSTKWRSEASSGNPDSEDYADELDAIVRDFEQAAGAPK